jgi:hypothetical protein
MNSACCPPGLRVRVFETNDQQPHGGATGLTDRRLLGGGGGHGFPRDDPVFAIVARDADFSALAVEAHGERDFAEEALDQDQHRNAQNNRPRIKIPWLKSESRFRVKKDMAKTTIIEGHITITAEPML